MRPIPEAIEVDTASLIERLKQALPSILEGYPVLLAYLYGSAAAGRTHPSSDVDIALVLDPRAALEPYRCLKLELDVEAEIERVCHIVNADVRVINVAPLRVQGKVVTEGLLLYARDEGYRVAYEVAVRRQYFDFMPVLRMMQRSYLERAGKGEVLQGHGR